MYLLSEDKKKAMRVRGGEGEKDLRGRDRLEDGKGDSTDLMTFTASYFF